MRRIQRPGLWLAFFHMVFITYGLVQAYIVARYGFYLWTPLFWAAVFFTYFRINRSLWRDRRRRFTLDTADLFPLSEFTLPNRLTWLADSARWPEPWTHHDLDYPEDKDRFSRR